VEDIEEHVVAGLRAALDDDPRTLCVLLAWLAQNMGDLLGMATDDMNTLEQISAQLKDMFPRLSKDVQTWIDTYLFIGFNTDRDTWGGKRRPNRRERRAQVRRRERPPKS
jgi:hypothetical protein